MNYCGIDLHSDNCVVIVSGDKRLIKLPLDFRLRASRRPGQST